MTGKGEKEQRQTAADGDISWLRDVDTHRLISVYFDIFKFSILLRALLWRILRSTLPPFRRVACNRRNYWGCLNTSLMSSLSSNRQWSCQRPRDYFANPTGIMGLVTVCYVLMEPIKICKLDWDWESLQQNIPIPPWLDGKGKQITSSNASCA